MKIFDKNLSLNTKNRLFFRNAIINMNLSESPEEEVIKAAPGSHNELNDVDETFQAENELTEEQLLRYLDGDDILDDLNEEECQDGTHPDFVRNLNDKLMPLAEGYADPTPSVLLGDLDITDSSTADNSSNNKENLSVLTKSSKTSKSKQVYRAYKIKRDSTHQYHFT